MSFLEPITPEEIEEEWNVMVAGTMRRSLTKGEAKRRVFMRKVKAAFERCKNHIMAREQAGQPIDPVTLTLFDMLSQSAEEWESD